MAKVVTFLGRKAVPGATLVLEGMPTWNEGDSQVFKDDAAAENLVSFFNGSQPSDHPMFSIAEASEESTVDTSAALTPTTGE